MKDPTMDVRLRFFRKGNCLFSQRGLGSLSCVVSTSLQPGTPGPILVRRGTISFPSAVDPLLPQW